MGVGLKPEVKATLGLGLLALVVTLVLTLVPLGARGPTPPAERVEAASPSPTLDPPREDAWRPASPGAELDPGSQPKSSPDTSAAPLAPSNSGRPGQVATPKSSPLVGQVLAPGGSPLGTEVYAFEVGPSARGSSAFGRGTPRDVAILARALSGDEARFLGIARSDEGGRFRFERESLGGGEVLLVAAGELGLGGLRLGFGARNALLSLEGRGVLRVALLTHWDLEQARLALDHGEPGAVSFPRLDLHGRTQLAIPPRLSRYARLHLTRPGWVDLWRGLSAEDVAAGLVTWSLGDAVSDLHGRVLDPEGAAWKGELSFEFRPTPRGAWQEAQASSDTQGAFVLRGFPAGRPVRLSIRGSRRNAYYEASALPGPAPHQIQLLAPSLLVIHVKRFEGDVDAIETAWDLEVREGEEWRRVDQGLISLERSGWRHPSQKPGLRIGSNRVWGLPPGSYRASLNTAGVRRGPAVEVLVPPRGEATCELGLSQGK